MHNEMEMGHVARMTDNRWTMGTTEWQPRIGTRSRGRQKTRWRDDIVKLDKDDKGKSIMEEYDRGLHPAVGGRRLGTRYKVQGTRYNKVQGTSYKVQGTSYKVDRRQDGGTI